MPIWLPCPLTLIGLVLPTWPRHLVSEGEVKLGGPIWYPCGHGILWALTLDPTGANLGSRTWSIQLRSLRLGLLFYKESDAFTVRVLRELEIRMHNGVAVPVAVDGGKSFKDVPQVNAKFQSQSRTQGPGLLQQGTLA